MTRRSRQPSSSPWLRSVSAWSLGESSQKSFDEIKESMAKDHAAVINSLGKTIRNQQQIIENMESKNEL